MCSCEPLCRPCSGVHALGLAKSDPSAHQLRVWRTTELWGLQGPREGARPGWRRRTSGLCVSQSTATPGGQFSLHASVRASPAPGGRRRGFSGPTGPVPACGAQETPAASRSRHIFPPLRHFGSWALFVPLAGDMAITYKDCVGKREIRAVSPSFKPPWSQPSCRVQADAACS